MISRLKSKLGLRELLAAAVPSRSDDVAKFEAAFAQELGARHAVAFPYGRTGLMLLLEALGLKDREIICPAYTCVVVAHAVVHSGNVPVFVDCEADGFLMDWELASAAVTPRTGAVIATSLFGEPVDLDRLDAFRRRHPNVLVIQDCAHSFGAAWNGRPVPSASVAAVFGLNVSKLMTSIFGGMITTDDDQLAAALRRVRAERVRPASIGKSLRRACYLAAVMPTFYPWIYGGVLRLQESGLLDRFVRYYDEARIDMPQDYLEGMSAVEARVGLAQIGRYADILAHRRTIAAAYHERLRDQPQFVLPNATAGSTWSHYVVRTDDAAECVRRAAAVGVQLGTLIEYVVPKLAAYREHRFLNRGWAERWTTRVINLPVHSGVSLDVVDRLTAALKQTSANHKRELVTTLQSAKPEPNSTLAFENHWSRNAPQELPACKLTGARDFLAPLLEEFATKPESLKVLDVGCGDGVHLQVLNETVGERAQTVGVDLSSVALDAARRRAPRGFVGVQTDAQALPFDEAKFDAAFAFGVLAYAGDPRRAFAEMCRVVKPGGLVGVWFYPRRSGILGGAFRTVRALCRRVGPWGSARIADLLVPLLPLLPTQSNISLGTADWRQCREVVLVNIAPPQLYFPEPSEIEAMFAAEGINISFRDETQPIAIWGRKPIGVVAAERVA
jgi:perosamine synthetase